MPECTFDSFIVDETNKFCVALCQEVTKQEQPKGYSPLVLHGSEGTGKTHLLNAIASEIRSNRPKASVVLIDGRTPPISDDGDSKKASGDPADSNNKVLLIDDLQQFSKEKELKQALSAVFETFYDGGKQVVAATQTHPSQLKGFGKRFISRLMSGIIADELVLPLAPTRETILRVRFESLDLGLPDELLAFIAEQVTTNARTLSSLPAYLQVYLSTTQETLNLPTVTEFIAILKQESPDGVVCLPPGKLDKRWLEDKVRSRETVPREQTTPSRPDEGLPDTRETGEAGARVAELESLKSDMGDEIAQLKSQLTEKDKELAQVSKETQAELKERETEMARQEKQLAKANEKITGLAETQQVNSGRIAELEGELQGKIKSIESLEKGRGTQAADLERLLKTKEEDLASAENLYDHELEEKQARIDKLQEQLSQTKDQEAEGKKAVEKTAAYLAELKAEIAEKDKALQASSTESGQEIDRLTRAKEDAEAQVAQLEGLVKEKEDAHAAFEEAIGQKDETISQLQNELGAAQQTSEEVEKGKEELSLRLSEAEAQIEQLETDASARTTELEDQLRQKQQEIAEVQADLEQKVVRAQQRYTNLEEQLASIEKMSKTAEDEKSSVVLRVAELESEVKERDQLIKQQEEETDRKVAQLQAELNQKQEELSKAASEFENKIKADVDELSRLKEELEEKDRTVAELEKTAGEKTPELQAELEQKDQALGDAQQALQERDDRVSQLEKDLAALEEKDREAHQDTEATASRISELEHVLEEKEKLLQELTSDGTDAASALQTELSKKGEELERLRTEHKAQMTQRDEKLGELKQQLEATVQKMDANAQEQEQLSEQIVDLRKALAAKEAELSKVEQGLPRESKEVAAEMVSTQPSTSLEEKPERAAEEEVEEDVTLEDLAEELDEEEAVHQDEVILSEQEVQGLVSEFSFDNYRSTMDNDFVISSAKAVAQSVGKLYNPFVIYGEEGTGKTHLLHAIGNYVKENGENASVLYCSVADFLSDFDRAVADKELETFAQGLHKWNILLLDDLGPLCTEGKKQKVILKLLRDFVAERRQLVITCDEPPVRTEGIIRAMVKFLENGLLAQVTPAQPEEHEAEPEVAVEEEEVREEEDSAEGLAEGASTESEDVPDQSDEEAESDEAVTADLEESPEEESTEDEAPQIVFQPDSALTFDNYPDPKAASKFGELAEYVVQGDRKRFPLTVLVNDDFRRDHLLSALGNHLISILPGSKVSFVSLLNFCEVAQSLSPERLQDALETLRNSDVLVVPDVPEVHSMTPELKEEMLGVWRQVEEAGFLILGIPSEFKKDKELQHLFSKGTQKKVK